MDYKELYEEEKRKNETLFRIYKERANAERDLRPKKDRFGYQLITSSETDWRYKDKDQVDMWGRPTLQTVRVWVTSLSSPYPADLPLDTIEGRLGVDMGRLAPMLGLGGYSPDYESAGAGDYFKVLLTRDFKIGLWVVRIWSVDAITPDRELLPDTNR